MITKEELNILAEKSVNAAKAVSAVVKTSVDAAMAVISGAGYKINYTIGSLDYEYGSGDYYTHTEINVLNDDGKQEFGSNFSLNLYKDHVAMNIGCIGTFTKEDHPVQVKMYKLIGFIWDNEEAICKVFEISMINLDVIGLKEEANYVYYQFCRANSDIKQYEREQARQNFLNQLKPGVILYNKYDYEKDGSKVPCLQVIKVCNKVVKAYSYRRSWDDRSKYELVSYIAENVKLTDLEDTHIVLD